MVELCVYDSINLRCRCALFCNFHSYVFQCERKRNGSYAFTAFVRSIKHVRFDTWYISRNGLSFWCDISSGTLRRNHFHERASPCSVRCTRPDDHTRNSNLIVSLEELKCITYGKDVSINGLYNSTSDASWMCISCTEYEIMEEM